MPAGATTSESSAGCSCRGSRKRPVGEGRERLDDAHEGDARRIVGVTILVRVDRELDPGEELIGAAVDRDSAGRVGLPPRHPDRQQRGAGRDPLEPARTSRARDEARHLGAVTLRPAGSGRILAGARVAAGSSTSNPRIRAPRMYGCTRSTPVSSSATVTPAPVNPGIADVGPPPAGNAEESSTLPGSTAAGIAARTGNTPLTSGSRTAIARERASSGAANPLNTR